MEDTRHDVEVSGFQTYTFGPDGGFLKGNGALISRSLSFRMGADEGPVAELTRHRIYRLDVTVTARSDPGGHLFIAIDEHSAKGTLSIFVDVELFRLLVQYPASTVYLGFRLTSDPVLENGYYSAKVHLSFGSATQLLSTAPASRHQAFDTELSEFVVRPQWSQLGRIAN